jgi:hypothetical protein
MNCNYICEPACKQMPEVDFSICSPKTFGGQINNVFLFSNKHPLLNEFDVNEFVYRLALPQNDVSKIITLSCIGSKQAPEINEVKGAYGISTYSNKIHSVIFEINELEDMNYNMMLHFERTNKALALYKTSSGKIYGGHGIPVIISFNQIIPEAPNELESLLGTISWEDRLHPCRGNSFI